MPTIPAHSTIDQNGGLYVTEISFTSEPLFTTHGTGTGCQLHTVPLRRKLKYLTQHKVKQSQVTDWTVNSTNNNTMKTPSFHGLTKTNQYFRVLCQCVKHKGLLTTPTLKIDNAFVGMAVCLDWTTETEYKEEFNSE